MANRVCVHQQLGQLNGVGKGSANTLHAADHEGTHLNSIDCGVKAMLIIQQKKNVDHLLGWGNKLLRRLLHGRSAGAIVQQQHLLLLLLPILNSIHLALERVFRVMSLQSK